MKPGAFRIFLSKYSKSSFRTSGGERFVWKGNAIEPRGPENVKRSSEENFEKSNFSLQGDANRFAI